MGLLSFTLTIKMRQMVNNDTRLRAFTHSEISFAHNEADIAPGNKKLCI